MSVTLSTKHNWWSLPAGATVLGRERDCDWCIDDPRLSRHHVRFVVVGSSVTVHDLQSANGVHINGDRIHQQATLTHGDLLTAGPLTFTVGIDANTALPAELVSKMSDAPTSESASTDVHSRSTAGMLLNPPKDGPLTPNPAQDFPGPNDPTPVMGAPVLAPAISASITSRRKTTLTDDGPLTPNPATDLPGPDDPTPILGAPPLSPGPGTTPRRGTTTSDPPPSGAGNRKPSTGHLQPQSEAHGKAPTSPLHANDPRHQRRLEHALIRGQRLRAGLVDGFISQALGLIPALILLLGGWALALGQVNAGVVNGLPTAYATDPATTWDLAIALAQLNGFLTGAELLLDEIRFEDRQAFATAFIASVLALLTYLVVQLVYLVAATVAYGAPWFHRQLRLTIIDANRQHQPGPVRAALRWFIAVCTWPLALAAIASDSRSPHDLLSGCRVIRQRGSGAIDAKT
ncbi:MAG: FHA domain-containing protein [Planctomycetota bacterium]|jgi:pSer/pThr/pTyr-binding forkhead associated (FHA) protein